MQFLPILIFQVSQGSAANFKVRREILYVLVGNLVLFPTVKNFENRLRFDKVRAMSRVALFKHSVYAWYAHYGITET